MSNPVSSPLLPLLLCALAPPPAAQTPDFHLLAADAHSGQVRWKTEADTLPRPLVAVHGGVAWAMPAEGEGARVAFDAATGAPLAEVPAAPAAYAGPLTFLEPRRADHGGSPLRVDAAPSRRILVDGAPRTVEAPVADVQQAGKLAVIAWAAHAGMGVTLSAYELQTGALAWELDARGALPGLDPAAAADLVVAPDGAWLVLDRGVVALDPATGKVRWNTVVDARAALTSTDGACRVARAEGALWISCRDGLLVVDADTGALRFWLETGLRTWPTPTLSQGLVLVGARRVLGPPRTPAPRAPLEKLPAYLQLVRDASWLGGYRAEFVRLQEPPPKDRVLWSLSAPPVPTSRLVVHLQEAGGRTVMVDVTAPLQKHGKVLVRLAPGVKKMVLMDEGRQLMSAAR
ncbi:MAG: PQQ-like beta-propeller repeat protein [Deltaproteobacteria bacterium]|nr:PQQ-like beta-propeller repeat protein [Deltaproteobacteria bacterium]